MLGVRDRGVGIGRFAAALTPARTARTIDFDVTAVCVISRETCRTLSTLPLSPHIHSCSEFVAARGVDGSGVNLGRDRMLDYRDAASISNESAALYSLPTGASIVTKWPALAGVS